MFDRLSRSWNIVRQSWNILLEDKKLMLFPVASGLASLATIASFAVPAIVSVMHHTTADQEFKMPPSWYALGFAFYMLMFFVTYYFNVAVMHCAAMRLDGHAPTLGDGIRGANSHALNLLAWSALSATVGIVLRTIEQRLGFIGRIVISLVGAAWAAVTYFVVPVLVFERVGAGDAVRRSTQLLKKTWGESLVATTGTNIVFGWFALLGMIPIFLGAWLGAAEIVPPVIAVGIFSLAFMYWLFLAVVSSAITSIYHVVLYRYAATGAISGGFTPDVLSSQFAPKVKRGFFGRG
jgi:hypothetical protein